MLNKIANISSSKNYGSNSRGSISRYEKYYNHLSEKSEMTKDQVVLSPATVFLASVNWNFSEINYESEDELNLKFSIDDVKFILNIDFKDFTKTSYQDIILEHFAKGITNNKRQVVKLKVKKPHVKIFEKYAPFPINGIKALFQKISSLNINGEINRNTSFTLSVLKEGIEEQIFNDFKNIFFVVYSFASKLGKYNFSRNTRFPENLGDDIIIEKVIVKNVF